MNYWKLMMMRCMMRDASRVWLLVVVVVMMDVRRAVGIAVQLAFCPFFSSCGETLARSLARLRVLVVRQSSGARKG